MRRALESLSLSPSASAATTAAAVASELSETKLRRLYDDLLAQGFAAADVEASLTAVVRAPWSSRVVPADEAVSITAALDWLCFELPTERLPRRYQGGVRAAAAVPGSAAAAVEVVHAPRTTRTTTKADATPPPTLTPPSRRQVARAAAARRAAEDEARAEAEAAAARLRDGEWIVRQYEDDDDSGGLERPRQPRGFRLTPEIERRARVRRRRRAFETNPEKHIATMRARETRHARTRRWERRAGIRRDNAPPATRFATSRRSGSRLRLSVDDLDVSTLPREHRPPRRRAIEATNAAERHRRLDVDTPRDGIRRESGPERGPALAPAPARASSSDSDDGVSI